MRKSRLNKQLHLESPDHFMRDENPNLSGFAKISLKNLFLKLIDFQKSPESLFYSHLETIFNVFSIKYLVARF